MREYFAAGAQYESAGYELRILPVRVKPAFFGLAKTAEVTVFSRFTTNEIAFQEVADRIISAVGDTLPGKAGKFRCNWFVCSESGGIYLYEAIAVRDHNRYKNMINRFVVVNSINGTVSFGPGHLENKPFSGMIAELLAEYRMIPREIWQRRLFDLFDGMLRILER